jgi:hypothetical protein
MRFSILSAAMVLLGLAGPVLAADSTFVGWKTTLVLDVTTTQTAYSDSWQGGEAGSLNWVSNLNGSAERQFSPSFNLRSLLKLSFGQTVTQDQDTKKWSKPKKATDLIDWDNLGRLTLHSFVDPYVAFRLQSQFTTQFNDYKTVYLSPMTLTESFGIARKFWSRGKNDILLSRLGLAVRELMTKNLVVDSSHDALTSTMTTNYNTTDGGLESVTDAYVTISPRLLYQGKLSLYKALFFSDKEKLAGTPEADDWKAIHVNWENGLTAQISRIVTTKLYAQFLYDKPISYRARIKETLGIGFLFKLK